MSSVYLTGTLGCLPHSVTVLYPISPPTPFHLCWELGVSDGPPDKPFLPGPGHGFQDVLLAWPLASRDFLLIPLLDTRSPPAAGPCWTVPWH